MSGDLARLGRGLDAAAGLAPAQARHHEIEQHAVGRLRGQHLQRFLAGARLHDVVSFLAQNVGQRVQVARAVVDARIRLGASRLAASGPLVSRVAQQRGQTRQDHARIVVLAHERVGARVQRLQLGAAARVGRGQHQAGGRAQRQVAAHAPDHRGAVDAGHDPVDDDRARAVVRRQAQPLLAVLGRDHLVVGRQRARQLLAEGAAVVDHQHRGARRDGNHVVPARERPRARDYLRAVIGLADVVGGADLQPADAIAHLGLGRQHQDRQVGGRRRRADRAQQIQSVAVGQQHVEHRDRNRLRPPAPRAPRRCRRTGWAATPTTGMPLPGPCARSGCRRRSAPRRARQRRFTRSSPGRRHRGPALPVTSTTSITCCLRHRRACPVPPAASAIAGPMSWMGRICSAAPISAASRDMP